MIKIYLKFTNKLKKRIYNNIIDKCDDFYQNTHLRYDHFSYIYIFKNKGDIHVKFYSWSCNDGRKR